MTTFTLRPLSIGLFVSCGLFLHSSVSHAQTLQEFNAVVEKHSAKSPAGGPKNNPTAAVFVFLRASKKLCWVADGKVMSVEVVSTKETNDTKEGGPTPAGEYLIGKRFKHDKHNIDWYKLYPRIEDNSGYYGYTAKTKTGRFAMGLHPGGVSEGCVTVKSADTPYDKADAWKSIQGKLDTSKLTYKKDDFTGLLYVEDK
ncbi:tlde1 domain-containing protein [Gemmata sp.]|uniref:tlde1 domain-containing protein n=1 Tax=Gemmata sp. TaxID=1914242 RepID=UPI003F72B0B5